MITLTWASLAGSNTCVVLWYIAAVALLNLKMDNVEINKNKLTYYRYMCCIVIYSSSCYVKFKNG